MSANYRLVSSLDVSFFLFSWLSILHLAKPLQLDGVQWCSAFSLIRITRILKTTVGCEHMQVLPVRDFKNTEALMNVQLEKEGHDNTKLEAETESPTEPFAGGNWNAGGSVLIWEYILAVKELWQLRKRHPVQT